MATPRLLTSVLLRTSRISVQAPARQFKALPISKPHRVFTHQPSLPRFHSSEPRPPKLYDFSDISKFIDSPSPSRILIDVREPRELATTGTIPGSLNIPVNSQPDAFMITADEFEDRFGFERPEENKEVVFYCKAGVRCRAAAGFAKEAGWKDVAEYRGSWNDWEANGGRVEGGYTKGDAVTDGLILSSDGILMPRTRPVDGQNHSEIASKGANLNGKVNEVKNQVQSPKDNTSNESWWDQFLRNDDNGDDDDDDGDGDGDGDDL